MSLNINNDETSRLAGELAQLTGETLTDAVTAALKERLERERRQRDVKARAEKLHAIGQRCAKLLRDGPSATDHGDFLFDREAFERVVARRKELFGGKPLAGDASDFIREAREIRESESNQWTERLRRR